MMENPKKAGSSSQRRPARQSPLLGAYEQHLGALKRYILRFLYVEEDVEDVVQEAFMRAYKAEANSEIREPKSYLFRVAKHVALNKIRQK